jgi:glyoxylase-like metal-dependent hydrolase (beta-lactamase superfamily II)
MSTPVSANIRMYRLHELGDCFLVTLSAGSEASRLLIDCGSFRNNADSISRLQEIVADIKKTIAGKPLNVVMGTHQHNDHVSGFVHCEKEFRTMKVEQVWLGWLDDPRDKMAQDIGNAHNNLKLQLAAVRDEVHSSGRANRGLVSFQILDDVLGFYGATKAGTPPDLPARGIEILKGLGSNDPEYLRPGRTLEMPGLSPGKVRVHVLGPPRIRGNELLYRKDPRSGESYDRALASSVVSATKLSDAVNVHKGVTSREEEQYPFAKSFKRHPSAGNSPALVAIMKRYNDRRNAWKKIDNDWLQQAGSLALYLDTFTNNSSVVLAIELVQSRKVLLFAADAQTGNWLSWSDLTWEKKDVSTDDLLARTVFYKVGHHASHNATLVAAFEKMSHPDLVALIPVHKKDPNITKVNGWKMPAKNLFKHLMEKTVHRVLQMDGVNPPNCDPNKDPSKTSWKKVGIKPKVTDLFIEIEIA